MTTEYSIQKMVSDGTLSTIALGIQYLQRNDIYIRIAGEETPQSGAPSGYTWSFINNTTLKILPVVPNGVEVVAYRRTDVDAMYNVYSQNAQFDEATIDENNQQLLYIAQEYLEQGIPGAGVDTLEYVRDDGSFTYYRMRRTDGSYSEEFPVPSASSSTKVLTRESVRRSYADIGYNVVGTFGGGFTIVNANDVGIDEATGKGFTGPNGPVAAGTNPTSPTFSNVSLSAVLNYPYKKIGSFTDGAYIKDRNEALLHSDGFYYVRVRGVIPHLVNPGTTPDVSTTGDWACVGLLNGTPIYSPDNFGHKDGDDAVASWQLALDAMPVGGKFELVLGSTYRFKSAPAKIRKSGEYCGTGVYHKSAPFDKHHAQVFIEYNGPVFVSEPYLEQSDVLKFGDTLRDVYGFHVRGDRYLYTQCGFVALKASQLTTKIHGNHINNVGYGCSAIASFGVEFCNNAIYGAAAGFSANPITFNPLGAFSEGESTILQTNATHIHHNIIQTLDGVGIDFNNVGNVLTIEYNVIEANLIGIHVSSLIGYTAVTDGTVLRNVTIKGNYLERNTLAHAIIGRLVSGFNTAVSAPVQVRMTENQINGQSIASPNSLVNIFACVDGVFENTVRNINSTSVYYAASNTRNVHLHLDNQEVMSGGMPASLGNTITHRNLAGVRAISSLSIVTSNADALDTSNCIHILAGTASLPLKNWAACASFISEFYTKEMLLTLNGQINVVGTGYIGDKLTYPCALLCTINLSAAGGCEIGGIDMFGGSVVVTGLTISNANKSTTNPVIAYNSKVTLRACVFSFSGQPANTNLVVAAQNTNMCLVGCTANTQLAIKSDASIILNASASLTGTQTKINGGQIFT